MNWPEFYFARHGETDWNRERRYQGSKDIPLNALGRQQADANGPLLRELLARDKIDPATIGWYASPLSRASETMDRMRAAFDVTLPPVIFDDRLKEISFGTLEGFLHDELPPELAQAPGRRNAEYWYHRPPEGENYEDVADRLKSFAADLPALSVIVAHGGIQRVLRHIVEGAPHGEVVNWPPPQGVIAHFRMGQMTMHESEMSSVQQA
ncbi:histidine phosphatase family protein [Mariluticola halotolerans]|uniref:histidine phosphatase family protein n=1 Tax=Mariluticola halotolerans TaxID=2909283 RepID=UPI0026E441D0|nr:histidine phosphatase family protein [Mariluticola halotolerans]UJQ95796.1 histidine phosphatase family protein [Mariluticola halotolerans]